MKRMFETEEEYRKAPFLNYSSLAKFYNDGYYSPDKVLMHFEHKSYFEYGKMFESLLQDTVKGTKDFEERFFVSDVDGNPPEKLVKWIDAGESLEEKVQYNKDGVTRSKTYKTLHAFIDACLDNPGKIPVSKSDMDMLKLHVERMCEMPYLSRVKCGDLLSAAEWQVPIHWECDQGIEKKALIDAIVDLGGDYLLIDIKTSGSEQMFSSRLNKNYWIQDIHYTEGINEVIGPCMQMLFLVAFKDSPYLCQPWSIDYGENNNDRKIAVDEYEQLCKYYDEWNKKPRGWLGLRSRKIYFNNR